MTARLTAILAGTLGGLLLGVLFLSMVPRPQALAADGQGAYTELKAVAEGYQADTQTEAFIAAVTTGTLTGLEDPVGKGLDLFQFYDPVSSSRGTKANLSLTVRAEKASSDTTVWVVYYYYDGTDYHMIALDQPGAGGVLTTESAEVNGTYSSQTKVMDSYSATHAAFVATSVESDTELWAGSY